MGESKTFQYTREMYTMLLGEFDTCQCHVEVLSTAYHFKGERVYIIVSKHKKDGYELVRFGNRKQCENIIDSYNLDYVGGKKPKINW